MLVLGHRGVVDPHGPVENTIAAVTRALAEGADGVEVDVRLTTDGRAVCVHDRDLHRVAGRSVEVARASFAELRRLQLPGGDTVPELAEVLDAVGDRAQVVLDLKPAGARTAGVVECVVNELSRRCGTAVVVSSSDVAAVEAVACLMPDVQRAVIAGSGARLSSAARVARALRADLHPSLRLVLGDPSAARTAVRRGTALRVWTVNDHADLALLESCAVTAVITDVPGRLATAALSGREQVLRTA